MTFRHAAALALVGWYLIEPIPDRDGKLLYEAPLTYWEQEGSFDTAAECQREREWWTRELERIEQKERKKSEAQKEREETEMDAMSKSQPGTARKSRGLGLKAADAAKCIASDDPRLKGN
jgi:hypothetical protein